MDKISVIMPVYNTIAFLSKSINSVLEQTHENIELLIINDGSHAACSKELEKFTLNDDRIRLFTFPKRKGVAAGRNFGIEKSEGEYIYFFDSDDYLPRETLDILIGHIGDYPMIRGNIRNTNFGEARAIIQDGLFKVKKYDDNRFNLIKNMSALNMLINKKYINHTFDENADAYTDLSFLIPTFIQMDEILYVKEAIYFKRKRNDPVTNPSLHQMDKKLLYKRFLNMYSQMKDMYDDPLANNYLDARLLNIYRKNIIPYLNQHQNVEELFEELSAAATKVPGAVLKGYDRVFRNEVKALKSGNLNKYRKVHSRHYFFRSLKHGLKSKRKFYIYLYRRFFMRMKMKDDLVFLESFLGKNYSDSPKYIYQYMLNNCEGYKYVWSFDEKKDIPGNHIQVKRFSLRYFYYLAKAKYWVSNSRLPKYLNKREGNVFLQTWHGTPLKTLVFDMDDIHSADPNYKGNFYEQSRRWDYLSSPNQYSSDIFRRAFQYDDKMLELGYPRNDILYQKNTPDAIQTLKAKMGIPSDKKVVLYAPTWRDDEFFSRGKYKFTLKLDLERLRETLSDEYVVLLRMHYFIANELDISDYEGFVYDFSKYDDIAELYLASDILITDYSSVFFDYAHLKRPILYYTYDLEKYRDQLRGFYIDMENDVPGPLLKTTDEIIDAIEHIAEVQTAYQEKYAAFYERFCKWDNGNASKNTVEAVFGKGGL